MCTVITGANGFVGTYLSMTMLNSGLLIRPCVRKKFTQASLVGSKYFVDDIGPFTDWSSVLCGATAVVHTAGYAHVMGESEEGALNSLRAVNVEGTINLARQAALAGVKRFVFLSSIKVNGNRTKEGAPFKSDDEPAPSDAYGVSKLEAEIGLLEIARLTGLEVVIIRPPLIYGPGVKGNLSLLIKWIKKGTPLPFGSITQNKRSLISLENLSNFIIKCISHPRAANQIFLVRDREDFSTFKLVKHLAGEIGAPVRLLPVPKILLRAIFFLLGKKELSLRLLDNLQIDDYKSREMLDWFPR